MVWLRRWFVLGPATKVEYDLRKGFYARLQRLPVSFHDRWQSGQLLSRMMQDMSMLRRWMAFGLVLLVVNMLTILVGTVLLFRWHWLLGTIFLVCSLPLWYTGYRFEKTYGTLARAEPGPGGRPRHLGRGERARHPRAQGVRARQARAAQVHRAGRDRCGRPSCARRGAIGVIWFWLVLLPDMAYALCLGAGIYLVQLGQLGVPELIAFFAMATVLRWPMESIGFLFSFTLDARTATDRIFEVFDEENTIVDPADAGHDRPAPRRARVRGRALPLSGCRDQRARPARRHRPRAAAGGDHGARRTHRLGQDDPHDAPVAPVRRDRRAGDPRRRRRARPHAERAAHARRHGVRRRDAVLADRARQRAARPRRPRSGQPRGRSRHARSARRSRRPASSTTCRTASTP